MSLVETAYHHQPLLLVDNIDPSLRSPPVRHIPLHPTYSDQVSAQAKRGPESNDDDSEYDDQEAVRRPKASSSKSSRAGSLPPSRLERKFKCTHPGCDKAYFKPSRLAEHELSHTGERPHKCPECGQSYLRASHLTAHMRTHLSKDAKPYTCERGGCGKSFWTATHLKRHEEMHDRAEVYACEQCESTFNKAHLLREHVALAHMPEGTKPFICSHEGCEASFRVRAKLKAHEKTHDPTRYTCSHPSHGSEFPSFPVWSALQTHMHEAHPPICPHAECNGRAFKSVNHLKTHLKAHAEQEADRAVISSRANGAPGGAVGPDQQATARAGLVPVLADGLSRRARKRKADELAQASVDADGGKSPKLRRVMSGEAGKDWFCDHDECEKRFKTKFALEAHRRAIHLKIRNHICPIDGCGKAYPHKASLTKHIATHSRATTPSDSASAPNAIGVGGGITRPPATTGNALTGNVREMRRFGCPHFAVEDFMAGIDPAIATSLNGQAHAHAHAYSPARAEEDVPEDHPRSQEHEHHEHEQRIAPAPDTAPVHVKQEPDLDLARVPHPCSTLAVRNDAVTPAPVPAFPANENHQNYTPGDAEAEAGAGANGRCWMRFWRVYDVRRHLKAEHGIELEDMEVRSLLLFTGQTGE
ncbi:hypothetical protein I317_01602 [Kwoniella heveanensis CBS 569]|nr:hypothetical protein I317_01602 [Kwoniella heveanensis CBS 569]